MNSIKSKTFDSFKSFIYEKNDKKQYSLKKNNVQVIISIWNSYIWYTTENLINGEKLLSVASFIGYSKAGILVISS